MFKKFLKFKKREKFITSKTVKRKQNTVLSAELSAKATQREAEGRGSLNT